AAGGAVLAVLHRRLPGWRMVAKCRRSHTLAHQIRPARRLRAAGFARRVGGDQARGGTDRPHQGRRPLREAGPMTIPPELIPPLMFGGLIVIMLVGYPVAFSLATLGFLFGFLAIEQGFFNPLFMQAIPLRVFGSVLSNELLLAIPFFTFMGAVLEKCGLAE